MARERRCYGSGQIRDEERLQPLEKQEQCYSRMHLGEIEQAGVEVEEMEVVVVVEGRVVIRARTGSRRKRNIMLHCTIMH